MATCENMTQEQKAKAYDEAIEKAKIWQEHLYDVNDKDYADELNYIFPELKESEDERIRKWIIGVLATYEHDRDLRNAAIAWLEKQKTSDKALQYLKENHSPSEVSDFQAAMNIAVAKAYDRGYNDGLEKQGEQKSANKTEPKFKNGQWIVWQDKCYKVNYNDCGYELVDQDGLNTSLEYGTIDENAYLWTIKDAKDGDVLTTDDGNIFVFDGTVEEGKYPFAYYGLTRRRFESYDRRLPFTHNNVHPATKEQRDTLMKAMTDAGYTFDFDKKELKKIEQKPADKKEHKFKVGDEIKAANEESLTITKIDDKGYWSVDLFICDFDEECLWDLVEQKSAWSEKDETTKNNISHIIRQYDKISKRENQPCWYVGDCLLWMQNIKDRVQPKYEWSEEDEYKIKSLINVLNDVVTLEVAPYTAVVEPLILWLKSLKERVQPQSHWKPSDEQMKGIECAIKTLQHQLNVGDKRLNSLYTDLKKLREE